MRVHLTSAALVFSILFLAGCVKKRYQYDPENFAVQSESAWAIPLATVSMGLEHVIETADTTGQLEVVSGQVLEAVFPFRLFALSATDWWSPVPPAAASANYEVVAAEVALWNSAPVGESWDIPLGTEVQLDWPAGAQVDSVKLQGGTLALDFNHNLSADVSVAVEIPWLRLNGEPLALTGNEAVNLNGWTLVVGGAAVLPVDAQATIQINGTPIAAGQAMACAVNLSLGDGWEAIRTVYGNWNGAGGMDWSAGAAWDRQELFTGTEVDFFLSEPRIQVFVENSFGCGWTVGNLGGTAFSSAGLTPLGGADFATAYSCEGAPTEGSYGSAAWTIQETDPLLGELLSDDLDSLLLTGTCEAVGLGSMFAMDSSALKARAELVLPAAGYLGGLRMQDTTAAPIADELAAALADPIDWTDVKEVAIRLRFENSLPVGTKVQVVLLNSLGESVDSFFEGDALQLIAPGIPDFSLAQGHPDAGRVVTATEHEVMIAVTSDRARTWMEAGVASIAIDGSLETTGYAGVGVGGGESVRFFPENRLSVSCAMRIELQIDTTP